MRVSIALLEFPLCWVCEATCQYTLNVDGIFDEAVAEPTIFLSRGRCLEYIYIYIYIY